MVVQRYRLVALVLMFAGAIAPADRGFAITALWDQGPEVDAWVYGNSTGNAGTRNRAPSFGGAFVDSETDRFFRSGAGESSRLGMGLFGFETVDQVEAGLDPSRYAIDSVTVTVWANKAGPSASPLTYTDRPKAADELLTEALASGVSSAQPMELFGVGFDPSRYDGFDLGVVAGGNRYNEASNPYPEGRYAVYPVIGDGEGGYLDASNSYTGGHSATSPDGETDPFDATPWAIGTTDATPGDSLVGINTFSFDLDLNQPGVVGYLQQSLSEGVVGFMLSSMHAAEQAGFGGPAYPDWRTREGASGIAYPTLEIEYALLPEPGDYDRNGMIDGDDYATWRVSYGSSVTPGSGADGNADGVINAADYTVWRDAMRLAAPSIAVPEPTGGVLALAGIAAVAFCFGTITFTMPRRPRQ